MLIFLLLSSINAEGDYNIQLYHASTEINSFFLDQGFLNPAAGSGIIGANINPATLGSSQGVDFYSGFSFSGESNFAFEESLEVGGMQDTLVIPFSTLYNAMGGLNFIGLSKKIGIFGVGISYGGGYKWGLEANLNGSISGEFRPEEPFELTHSDHPDIPEGDTISVDMPLNGKISVGTQTPIRVEYSKTPFFIGGGVDLGLFNLGAGFKFFSNRLFGEGSFNVLPENFSVLVDTTVTSQGEEWTIDSVNGYAVINDTLLSGKIASSGFSATQTAFDIGMLLDAKLIKFSLAYEYAPDFSLSGGYEWNFSLISDLPDSVEINTDNLNVDTASNTISGNVGVVINDLPKDVNSERDDNMNLFFSSYHSLKAGLQFNLSLLKIGINGTIDFPSSGDYSLSKWSGGLSLGLPIPVVDVDMGLAGSLLCLSGSKVEENIYIPSAIIGMSLSYGHDHLRIDIPIKYDITQLALSSVEELKGKGTSNLWDNLSFGFGLRVRL